MQNQIEFSAPAPQLQVVPAGERAISAVIPFRSDAPASPWVALLTALPHVSTWRLIYFAAGKRLIDLIGSIILLAVLSPSLP